MSVVILQGDARQLPLPDASVDLIATSPPYYQMRAYTDGGERYEGQIGSEETPREYIANLLDATREWMRVLKPSGSMFVNLGDSYSSGQPFDNELTVGDAGWLAGLIDADGTITVRRTQQPQMRAPTFEGIIAVEQEDRAAVERAHAITGRGAICTINHSGCKPMYRWTASTQQARWIAERIWPWLRIKQRQALAIVELGRHRQEHSARGRWNPIRPEWTAYRERICRAVRAWNQRTPDDWEPPLLPVIGLPLRPRRVPPKSLTGLPWRFALACIDELGLILRRDIIWSKPSGLPESVSDRCRTSHEYLFHLVKEPRYYAAVDEIRQPHRPQSIARTRRNRFVPDLSQAGIDPADSCHPLGALPGSVWEIASAPLVVPERIEHAHCCGGQKRDGCEDGLTHHAAFPPALAKKIILGWSPSGICTGCGEGRRPVVDRPGLLGGDNNPDSRNGSRRRSTMDGGSREWAARTAMPDRVIGYACACTPVTDHPGSGLGTRRRDYNPAPHNRPQGTYGRHQAGEYERVGPWREYHFDRWVPAATRPAVVLDPFSGTGTTVMVADVLSRTGVGIERSQDYCRLAQWRTADPAERARALGVPKPPPVPQGQMDLFGDGVA